MKKGFALAVWMLLVPFVAFGMQPLTEAEMESINASSGVTSPIDDEKTYSGMEVDSLARKDFELSVNDTETRSDVSRLGSGVAIFINDVIIYTGGSSEIWYQTSGASIGISR